MGDRVLSPGQNLLHYHLLEKIGEGGMGVVWKARDQTLERDVAIKLLPEALAHDPARLARFEREAKLLAALSHRAIAGIHSLHHAAGVHFVSMELVSGEDLSSRLTRGPIPVREALDLARQMADALQAAHEQAVIHRDLKPANVRITPDGHVKLLDFGLAKALKTEPSGGGADPASASTLTALGTQVGMILGTAAYMSPEQAAGHPADQRADIWAFGVVLWEMLTGERLFRGESLSHVLASVIKDEPDFGKLPPETPEAVRRLLQRCLRKDPRSRLQSIGDARVALEDYLEGRLSEAHGRAARVPPKGFRPGFVILLAIAALLIGGLGGWLLQRPELSRDAATVRWDLLLPKSAGLFVANYPGHSLAISPDGRNIAYASEKDLYVRRMDDLEFRALPETEYVTQPFFSPDGAWVGYFARSSIRRIPVAGGRPVTIARDVPNAGWLRGSWSEDGRIVFDTWNAGLRVVSADGGPIRVLTKPQEEWHLEPQMLPGGTYLLYTVQSADGYRIESRSLDGGEAIRVLKNASYPRYLTSGHLLFVREGGLMVAPFDRSRLQVTGSPKPLPISTIVDHPNMGSPTPQLVVSDNGTLVYAPLKGTSLAGSTLVRVDRQGKASEIATLPYVWPHFTLSRDGNKLVVSGRAGAEVHFDIFDLLRKTLTTIRTDRQDYPGSAVWSPDGRGVYLSRFGPNEGAILFQPADGSPAQPVVAVPEGTWLGAYSISSDGRYLAVFGYHPDTGGDISYIDTQEEPATLHPYLVAPGDQISPSISPDGQWMAYEGQTGENYSLYLRRFPSGESRTKVLDNAGSPLWSRDGKELFFQPNRGGPLGRVSVGASPDLKIGEVRLLFEGAYQAGTDIGRSYAIAPDGKSFFMIRKDVEYRRASELIVVQNWFTEVKEILER